jgi:hypothetical protein
MIDRALAFHMKLTFVAAVLAGLTPAVAQQLKVDHVTVAGQDLARLQKNFAAVGIPTEYGGKHTNGMTEMALSSFADGSYLELIAGQPGADVSKHYWGNFMTGSAGPCAWAVSVIDMASETRKLQTAGVVIHPAKSGRKRPDGVSLEWESASVGPGPQGTFFPFLIRDETPRERRAFPSGKPTAPNVAGVALVVIAVRDLEGAVRRYREAFGLPEPRRQQDAALGLSLAAFEGTPVVLAAVLNRGSWLTGRLKEFGEGPCAFVLSTGTAGRTPAPEQSTWFGQRIRWLDPRKLDGARIGMTTQEFWGRR